MRRNGHFLASSRSRRRRLAIWMSQSAQGPARELVSGAFPREQLEFPCPQVVARVLADPTPLTWLFTGDSLTKTESVSPKTGTLVSHLMGILRARGGRHQDSVVSTVFPECRLATLLEEREFRIDRFRPDCVIVNCHPREIEESADHYDDLEQTVHALIAGNRNLGALTVFNLPIRGADGSLSTSIERLIRLEALRGSALESGALVIDHWADWESHATSAWYLPCGRFPSHVGLSRIANHCAEGMGLAPEGPSELGHDSSISTKASGVPEELPAPQESQEEVAPRSEDVTPVLP